MANNKPVKHSLAELDRISSENLRISLEQARIKIADAAPPQPNLQPWDDATSEISSPNNVITSDKTTAYANSTYWFLIPAAVLALVFVCRRASSIMRMCSNLGKSIHTGITFFSNKPLDARAAHSSHTHEHRPSNSMC